MAGLNCIFMPNVCKHSELIACITRRIWNVTSILWFFSNIFLTVFFAILSFFLLSNRCPAFFLNVNIPQLIVILVKIPSREYWTWLVPWIDVIVTGKLKQWSQLFLILSFIYWIHFLVFATNFRRLRDQWQRTFVTLNGLCPSKKKPTPCLNGHYQAGWKTKQNQMRTTCQLYIVFQVLKVPLIKS